MTKNLKDMTISEANDLISNADQLRKLLGKPETALVNNNESSEWKIGQAYFVRTVTYHIVGKLESVTPQELWFSGAAWVAESDRFSKCLHEGPSENAEIEHAPDGLVAVGRGALVDAYEWNHPLLRSTK